MKRRQYRTGRIFLRGSTWWIQYQKNGRRVRESSESDNRKVADRMLRDKMAHVTNGTHTDVKIERIRVSDLWESYSKELKNNGRGLDHPQRRWEKHLSPFLGEYRAITIGTDVLNEYIESRLEEGAKNATINRELAVLRGMMRHGYFSTPQKVTRLPKFPHRDEDNVRKGFLDPQQYDAIADRAANIGLWMRAIFEIAYVYGWRRSELLMQVKQADFNANVLRLETSKNGEGREVQMTPKIRAMLAACARDKRPDDFLFTRESGKPVRNFRKAWSKVCTEAEVPGLLVHDLRRTAVRNLVRAGVPEKVAMTITGHKTRSVFERYNIVSQTDIATALTKLEDSRLGHNLATNPTQNTTSEVSSTNTRPN
jgi:integrase